MGKSTPWNNTTRGPSSLSKCRDGFGWANPSGWTKRIAATPIRGNGRYTFSSAFFLSVFFQSGRLHTVGWRLSPQGDFIELAPRYEELLQGLTKEHPASQGIKSKRQLNMARFLNNEWTTVEGVRINMSMFDAIESIPVWISVQTSGDGGAWLRMESNDRRLAQEYRHTQQLATIRARKDAEAKSYNKFLDSLVGKDIAQLASKWGAPTGTTGLPNGEVIYVWDIRSGDWQCRTSIFTMVNGKITKWQWSGNNCRVVSE